MSVPLTLSTRRAGEEYRARQGGEACSAPGAAHRVSRTVSTHRPSATARTHEHNPHDAGLGSLDPSPHPRARCIRLSSRPAARRVHGVKRRFDRRHHADPRADNGVELRVRRLSVAQRRGCDGHRLPTAGAVRLPHCAREQGRPRGEADPNLRDACARNLGRPQARPDRDARRRARRRGFVRDHRQDGRGTQR